MLVAREKGRSAIFRTLQSNTPFDFSIFSMLIVIILILWPLISGKSFQVKYSLFWIAHKRPTS